MGKRSTYWKAASGRAWREAIAASPWSSPVRFLSAVAAVAVAAYAGWLAGQALLAVVGGFAAVAAIIAVTFVFKLLWAVPADMAAEQDARLGELQTAAETDDVAHHVAVAANLSNRRAAEAELSCTVTLRNTSPHPIETVDTIAVVSIDGEELRRAKCTSTIIRPQGEASYTVDLGEGHLTAKAASVEIQTKWGKPGRKPSRTLRRVIAGGCSLRHGRFMSWEGRVILEEETAI